MKNKQNILKLAPYVLATIYVLAGSVGVIFGGIWGAIGIGGALLVALVVGLGQGRFALPDRKAMLFVFLLLGLAALSVVHAVDAARAQHVLLKLATILLPLLLLASSDVRKQAQPLVRFAPNFAVLISIMVVVLSGMIIYAANRYAYESDQVTKLNRGLSYLLMLVFPLLGCLWADFKQQKRTKWIVGGLLTVVLCALVLTHSRATQLGVVISFFVFAAASLFPAVVTYALGLMSLVSAAWPWLAGAAVTHGYNYVTKLPQSWYHRVEIWDYLYYRVIESPLWGHGIGNAYKLDWTIPHGAMYRYVIRPAAHPHNAMVQLWVELGAGGVCVALFLSFLLLRSTFKMSPSLRALALATYAYVFCLLMCAYNLWTDSLWSALALCLFAFAVVGRQQMEIKGFLSLESENRESN